jgi:hypothetical protein
MAMQSAFVLCERLAAGSAVGPRYALAWRRLFASRIRLAAIYAHIAMHPWASRAILPLLRRRPELLTLGARLGGKVRCAVDVH